MAEQTVSLQPSESQQVSFEAIPHEARMYQVSVDGLTGSFRAIALPIAGSIAPGKIWYKPLAGWEFVTSGKDIPLNEKIHLAPLWINRSEINIIGHVDLEVTYPDGTKASLSAVLNQDREAGPNSGYFVQFAPFISTQEGTYTLEATLSSAGQVLDSVTFTLVAAAVTLPFTFSNVSASLVTMSSAPAFKTIVFRCTVTNPNFSAVTRTVNLWRRYEDKYGKKTSLQKAIDISLSAKGATNFVWDGNGYDSERDAYNGPLISLRTKVCMWLEDAGNKSQEGCVYRGG